VVPVERGHEHEDVRAFWEQLYGERDRIWSGRVNAALEREASGLAPGRALDLGCGEGGDALWLAERGWTVTAVDISQTALDRGAAEASRRGLRIDWQHADLSTELPSGPYDLVSAQFLQSPVELLRTEILRRAAAEVAPGGVLLVVGHAAPPPWSHHDPDPALFPTAARVVTQLDLPGGEWETVRAEEVTRQGTGPDGQRAELVDSVALLRRR
jgi:SAM-dependent methyltransferase